MARPKKRAENSLSIGAAIDDGHATVDTRKMKTKISWVKMSISLAAIAGAAFFFWRAAQVGLSNEKIIDTVLAVLLGGIALLAFIFQ